MPLGDGLVEGGTDPLSVGVAGGVVSVALGRTVLGGGVPVGWSDPLGATVPAGLVPVGAPADWLGTTLPVEELPVEE